jgi:endonuclease/exonuclease/phosphatase (EEP) superfamily protein YafD
MSRTESADLVARAANIQQVADYIDKWSVGNSVLVFGDTNSRYTRALDKIAIFQTQNSMTDAWVQLERAGVNPTVETVCNNPSLINTCETVDKLFYRGSKQLNLEATYFNYESSKFLQADGSILSDHNPITVNFTWTASNSFRQSGFWGGPHGDC